MKSNLFGTDGIRGAVGVHPFTAQALPSLGKAIALWAARTYGSHARLLLAHDTRVSCSWVKAALQSGLLLQPLTIVDAGVLPTPGVFQLIRNHPEFHAGIVISASHNPYHDNGIKIIDAKTGKISANDEAAITEFFYNLPEITEPSYGTTILWESAQQEYIKNIVHLFNAPFLQGKKVVLDCANGATSTVAPHILRSCGAQVTVINHEPNGTNINERCGALHLQSLQRAVVEQQADIGFAFDGDGDRVIAVNSEGIIKNGDDLIALLIDHPNYSHQQTIISTVMANQGFELFLKTKNKKIIRTAVGDRYVAEALEKEQALLGGEQSGHLILRDYLTTGDGIFAALRVLETLIHTQNWKMETFEKYPQVLVNVTVLKKTDLDHSPLAELIAESQSQLCSGRLLVRYSGTEPLLRIMAEAPTEELARQTVDTLSEKLSRLLA